MAAVHQPDKASMPRLVPCESVATSTMLPRRQRDPLDGCDSEAADAHVLVTRCGSAPCALYRAHLPQLLLGFCECQSGWTMTNIRCDHRATAGMPLSVPDDSVLASSVRPASPGAASTAYFSVASARSPSQEQAASAGAASRTRCAVVSLTRESTASSARQHSTVAAAAVGESAADKCGPQGSPLAVRRMRTTKRAGQQSKRSDAVRAGIDEASTAFLACPRQDPTGATVCPPVGQWWEAPQQRKTSGQSLDARELIMGGLTAAKTRGAINLTANATVGEPPVHYRVRASPHSHLPGSADVFCCPSKHTIPYSIPL